MRLAHPAVRAQQVTFHGALLQHQVRQAPVQAEPKPAVEPTRPAEPARTTGLEAGATRPAEPAKVKVGATFKAPTKAGPAAKPESKPMPRPYAKPTLKVKAQTAEAKLQRRRRSRTLQGSQLLESRRPRRRPRLTSLGAQALGQATT